MKIKTFQDSDTESLDAAVNAFESDNKVKFTQTSSCFDTNRNVPLVTVVVFYEE